MSAPIYQYAPLALNGQALPFSQFEGQVLLIVNTASECGFTPQYTALEALFQRYRERGLTVIGFPCNQFGNQEPASATEIGAFCQKNFGVTFPLMDKIDVNGKAASPLWQYLKAEKPGLLGLPAIKWNFTKFLIDRQGQVIKRFAPQTTPESLASDIEALL
ncbi:glutathione peroxidase [Craterilacuibacter sp.]|uniref:glutathione peroxidase n=1 Tax=Craterilacuibacter sp. TaxID=2870909 RepID=UPI003F3C372D